MTGPWWDWDTENDDERGWLSHFSGEDVRALVRERNRLLPAAAELDRLRMLVEMLEKGIPYEQARAALQPEGSAGSEAFTTRLAAEMATEHLLNAKDDAPPRKRGSARDGG